MKKIILAIFLLSISSNVFAKEETWSCHSVTTIYGDTTKEDFENSEYYKIDTVNVKIYFRNNFKWEPETSFGEDCIYDEENENLFCRYSWDDEEKYGTVYDLVTKEIVQLVGGLVFSIRDCKKTK